ncbi:MAG: guanylate kinase [Gammaproteobacteria bacterium]|nr:guanylate kinase [Gammaproteobacteria bacterium]
MSRVEGRLIVISAPSGAGKTSLVNALLERDDRLAVSVSHTTRRKRPNEVDGKHYFFVEQAKFDEMRDQGAFLEHATVFGNAYGTSHEAVARTLADGRDVVLEIDWQGAAQVRSRFPDAVSVFVLPPSMDALLDRLTVRGEDGAEEIGRRWRQAVDDISHYDEFNYVVVNNDFDEAVGKLAGIIDAERRGEKARRECVTALVEDLLQR